MDCPDGRYDRLEKSYKKVKSFKTGRRTLQINSLIKIITGNNFSRRSVAMPHNKKRKSQQL